MIRWIALLVVGLSSTIAAADDGIVTCKEPAPGTQLVMSFKPDISIYDLSLWVTGFTCKNIVIAPDIAKRAMKLTVIAPKKMTPKQGLQLFVDTIEATGLVVTQKPDTILIKLGPNMPKACPDLAQAPVAPAPPAVPAVPEPTDETEKLWATIVKHSETQYDVPRAVIDKLLADPVAAAKGARVVPAMKDGKPEGMKLYAIRPSSVFAKLGIANGDTLLTINGFSLATPDKALEAYAKLRSEKRIELALLRRGKPVTFVYMITK